MKKRLLAMIFLLWAMIFPAQTYSQSSENLFFDLEADDGMSPLSKLAILESPYFDRCLDFKSGDGLMNPIYSGKNLVGYQACINGSFDVQNVYFLTFYSENRRESTDGQVIPYYSFSITYENVEYFLNVASISGKDFVYWTALSAADKLTLIDWEANPEAFPTYKFCLPYKVDAKGSKNEAQYGDKLHPLVYLQTLDIDSKDDPFLIVTGGATSYISAIRLSNAMKDGNIDPAKSTAWILSSGTKATLIYNPGDIAVINAMIDNNGLKWTKAEPADGSYVPKDWTGVSWSNDAENKCITHLDIYEKSLTGALNVSKLTNLQSLGCWGNNLTSLDVSGLINLQYLYCGRNNLTSLDISGLINLTELYCGSNSLTYLDVSALTNLQGLGCENNNLTELGVSNLTNLLSLISYGNSLTKLDVTNLANLQELYCGSNSLTYLDVSALTNLQHLQCSYNNLNSLDVSKLINLKQLNCYRNNLTSLDLTGLNNLTEFIGSNQTDTLNFTGSAGNYTAKVSFSYGATFDNPALSYSNGVLTSTSNAATTSQFTSPTGKEDMELSGTLTMTYPATTPLYNPGDIAVINAIIDNNGLKWTKAEPADGSYVPEDWALSEQTYKGIDWSDDADNKRITTLAINGFSLTGELNVSGLTYLEFFYCDYNKLTSLNVSKLTYLWDFHCNNNNLTSLDVSELTNLQYFYCFINNLTSLDVSKLTNLKLLTCSYNNLTSLDVSKLTNLQKLTCSYNNLTSLDVFGLTNLQALQCSTNNLTSLDVSGLNSLQYLNCDNNHLTSLDLTGLNSLTNFTGSNQTDTLNFIGSTGNYTANITFGVGATFNNSALSYSNGVLTSTSNAATTSGFTSPTGKEGMELTGTLTMTYPTTTVPVTGIALNTNSLALDVNATQQLIATVSPENATNKNYTWRTSNVAVATVANGLVVAVAEGQATITVTTEDGSFSATCTVTVSRVLSSDASLAELTVSQGTLTPAFSPYITEYTVAVANAVTSINLLAVAHDAGATLEGTGTMELIIGENIFHITVTAENGDQLVYVVTVNRATPTAIAVTGVSLDKASIALKTGNSEQLTATILPANATNKNLSWSSSDLTIASVSATGLIMAVGEGTATITVTTEDGGFTAVCSVEVSKPDVEIVEEEPVSEDGKGKMTLSLTIPANTLFSGTFHLTLPTGMHLDLKTTYLADNLQSLLSLTIEQNADGSWLFIIAPIALRSSSEDMVYSRIVEIGYTVDETVEEGTHEAVINDLSFEFDNGTIIEQEELPVIITVSTPVGIKQLIAETFAYISNRNLYIQSPAAETIQVYSVNGILLYHAQKPAGNISYPVNQLKGTVLIVKGSSGWTKKAIMN